MKPSTPCPPNGDLQRLLLGLVEATDLEHHFVDCPQCATHAALVATDEFVDTTRAAGARVLPEVPAAILDRLRGLGPPRRPADELQPGERLGAYLIERDLGRGGMGTVYLARHDQLARPVALKVLPSWSSADRVARFRREVAAIATLHHPHVVQVFEVGEGNGRVYYAMEYVPGGTLARRLADSPLPPHEAARVAEMIAQAIAVGHEAGVIHRDLKPANVLLDPPTGVKVADFGLAKIHGSDSGGEPLTESGMILGTPSYMAPEQAAGDQNVGPAADVYGVGAILYECLTSRPPFTGPSPLHTLDLVRTEEPVPPSRLQPAVPRDLQTICLKCLEKNPKNRYLLAADLAADLGRFLRGEPVVARPVGSVTRAAKWAKRRPAIAVLLALLTATLVALGVVVAVYTVQLREEVNRVNENAAEAGRQKQRATASYRDARDTLRRVLARLDAHTSADIPRLKELREEQLREAMVFYEMALAGLDDPDPEIRLDAASALAELAWAKTTLGRPEAAADFRRAADELDRLPEEYRTRPDCRRALILCLNILASAAGHGPDAESLSLRARDEAEALVAGGGPEDRVTLAAAEHNLAGVFLVRGEFQRAEAHALRAVAVRAPLVDRPDATPAHRAAQADSIQHLGLIYSQWNRRPQAADAFNRAAALLEPLVPAHPGTDRYELVLTAVYVNWGNLLRASGDGRGAFGKFDRAVGLAEGVLAREPRYVTARSHAKDAHGARAVALVAAWRFAESIADWDRVVALTDGVAQLQYRVDRAVALAGAGRWVRAGAEAHELDRLVVEAGQRFNLVRVHALASTHPVMALGGAVAAVDIERHVTAAMWQLRELHAAGYFRPPAMANRLTSDITLAALRGRPEFRRLLDDVAAGPK